MSKSSLPNQKSILINIEKSGFYDGFNKVVALIPKLLIIILIAWVGFSPSSAGQVLLEFQNWSTQTFGALYIYVTAFYTLVC